MIKAPQRSIRRWFERNYFNCLKRKMLLFILLNSICLMLPVKFIFDQDFQKFVRCDICKVCTANFYRNFVGDQYIFYIPSARYEQTDCFCWVRFHCIQFALMFNSFKSVFTCTSGYFRTPHLLLDSTHPRRALHGTAVLLSEIVDENFSKSWSEE